MTFTQNLLSWLWIVGLSDGSTATTEDNDELASRLLDEYGNSILRLAYSYVHNLPDAQDILQETMIHYFQKPPLFLSKDKEKAWFLTVCANLSKNRIKFNQRHQGEELIDNYEIETSEDLQFVWQAVKQLSANYAEVIHLFYYEGYSTKEIASILKRNESTVRSDLKRAREKLKEILKEEYDFA